ncbi:hypothetical protein UPYG_G00204060 [Umbra pygmaea]|uniref:Uncharacterized protein n=1 Tax=Umbra pygmaea TaxID=75934 RepID=A0ABD0X502_UMBPY
MLFLHSRWQLAEYLVLPVNMCNAKDSHTKVECGAPRPFEVNIKSRGTAAILEWLCPHGHTVWKWSSQPTFKYGMLAGDFMLACNILLSGNNYAKISLLFKFMKMGMVDRSSFFRIQDTYCVDTIKDFWNDKRAEIITKLQSKGPIVALGDARMDSPGFCAQYCTYTTMENESKQIIYMVNIDKRDTMRNSVVMEKEGFIRTFDTLPGELSVTEIYADAHAQISALFRQQNGCAILRIWNKDICNHFWYCCKTADTYEEFIDIWMALLHHVTGEHTWALGECQHGPLVERREKEWIESGSVAHDRLTEIILDGHWLKGVPKYLRFRSTAELESFHNHILMYASKALQLFTASIATFGPCLLAWIITTMSTDKPGEKLMAQYSTKRCTTKSRKWSLYSVKVEKDYSYIVDLQNTIVRQRLSSEGMPRRRTRRPDDPHQHGVLSGVPAPTTEELLQIQVSRGIGQSLPKD